MTGQPDPQMSAQEYFRQDQQSDSKLEYYAGTVVAQAGSTARHNLIAANLIAQHTPCAQRYTRQTAHFWYAHLTDDLAEQIAIPAIGCTLAFADVYGGISL